MVKISQLNSDQGSESFEIAFDGINAPKLLNSTLTQYLFNNSKKQVYVIQNDPINNRYVFLRWSLSDNKLVDLNYYPGIVGNVSLSNDEKYLAISRFGNVELLDAELNKYISTIVLPYGNCDHFAFSRNGNLIALAGVRKDSSGNAIENRISLYQISKSNIITPIRDFEAGKSTGFNYFRGISFSPKDSSTFISIHGNSELNVWNMNAPGKLCELIPYVKDQFWISSVSRDVGYDKQGNLITNFVFSSKDSGYYSPRTFDLSNCLELSSDLETINYKNIVFSENGDLFATHTSHLDDSIKIWDWHTISELISFKKIKGSLNTQLKFTKDRSIF